MRGDLTAALRRLAARLGAKEDGAEGSLPTPDALAIAVLKAELFYLNGKDEDALNVFDTAIADLLASCGPEIQQVVQFNRNEVATSLMTGEHVTEHYRLFDERQLLGFELIDYRALAHA